MRSRIVTSRRAWEVSPMEVISSIYYGSSRPAEGCDPRGALCEDRNLCDGNLVITEISG
ncbi:hypothetical protein A2U01_0081340, partial [Trifolium medium]|nr:hypothetical protein [Trifolium medium]